jgi:predicted ATPase/DNA-binding SARP family transcriptional activator
MLRRQTRGLLYRLAADLRPVARTQLCYLFWPDVADATARRNLTRLLVLLRRALPQPTCLLTEEEIVALDPELTWCDTAVFLRLTTADPPARRQTLAQAAELARGPFLDGFALPDCPEFEAWMDRERRTWERRVFDTFAALIEAHTASHDYDAAIAAAHRYLRADELAEEIHRRLIALYAAAGDRTAALRQFEHCAVLLERELGVSPLPETRAAYEAARDGAVMLASRTPDQLSPIHIAAPAVEAEPQLSVAGIPAPSSTLIGRSSELAEVTALLRRADVRLLTLSGPGGAGKTRLAIEAAQAVVGDFADGAAFVSLAPLRDAARVVPAIIETLGLADQGDRPLLVRLQDALRDRELLLVLDNFEHVVTAAPEVAALLAAAPRLTILTTSRALLHITGEHIYPVPPLALPDPINLPPLDVLAQVDSIALFLASVRARLPTFRLTEANARDVAAICARLDGLPLAIELAAARAALLSPRMLLARLNHRLTVLIGGPRDLPERQRTLRATIDWSYHLLDLSEQLLFGRLAVFAGGWDLDAAEAVSEAVGPLASSTLDALHALLDKHLVQRVNSESGEPRFTMLETIREYALERLTERGEAQAVQQAHAQYFLALAEAAAPAVHGPAQIAWFDRLDEEHANLRVALAWLLSDGDGVEAICLTGALNWFWFVRGHLTEGRSWLEQALAQAKANLQIREALPPSMEARARLGAGLLALFQGDLATARSRLEASATLCRSEDGRAAQLILHETLAFLVVTCVWQSDWDAVNHTIPEYDALVRSLDEPWANAFWAFNTGRAQLHHHQNTLAAQTYLREAQALFQTLGDIRYLAQVLLDLGTIALDTCDVQSAHQHLIEALAAVRVLKDRGLEANTLNNLGEVARLMGDDVTAAQHYEASLRVYRDQDSKQEIPRILHNLGYLALHANDMTLARTRFVESLLGFRAIGHRRGMAEPIAGLACVQAHGRIDEGARRAARLWGAAHAIYTAERAPVWPADRAEHERYQALARDTIGSSAFDTAYAEGAMLNVEQAISEALTA